MTTQLPAAVLGKSKDLAGSLCSLVVVAACVGTAKEDESEMREMRR